jgi:hypothetical protein
VGSLKASRFFRVSQRTLKRYVKLERNSANRIETKLGREFVLPASLEEGLMEDCLNMSMNDVRRQHVPAATDTNAKIEERCFLCGPCLDVINKRQS